MAIELDRTARRIIGVFIEKELTTPQQYPLSINALASGCNQRSNRDPVLNLRTFEIEGTLRSLYVQSWVTNTREAGGRVLKWRHRAAERMAVEGAEMAVMAELMLRGSQQPGELRTRANRMHPINSQEGLERILESLQSKGLVRRLAPRPGERVGRWDHTLYPKSEEPGEAHLGPAVAVAPAPAPGIGSTPRSTAAPIAAPDPALIARIEALEEALERLEARIARFETPTDS